MDYFRKMVSRNVFKIVLLYVFCHLSDGGLLKYNINLFKKEHPDVGTKFIYVLGEDGKLDTLSLEMNDTINKELQGFNNREGALEKPYNPSENSNPFLDKKPSKPCFSSLFLTSSQAKNKTKHFNFYRKDITFTLFTKKNLNGINMTHYNFAEYDNKKLTIFITHGFVSSGESESVVLIRDNFLKKFDYNVIVVNWSPIAGIRIYPITLLGVGPVADYLSDFIFYLLSIGLKESDIHLIGHSLGAHLMGFTGKRLIHRGNKKIGRITGLDPAGPLMNLHHLNTRDARFVDIIHTDRNLLGIDQSIGHIDFYPNGGAAPQPECQNQSILNVDSCSHSTSYRLYAATILEPNLYVSNCNNNQIPLGYETPTKARGNCYLRAIIK